MGREADHIAHSTPAPTLAQSPVPTHRLHCARPPGCLYTILVCDPSTCGQSNGQMCSGETRQGKVLLSGNEVKLHFFFPVKRDFYAARLGIQWDEEK